MQAVHSARNHSRTRIRRLKKSPHIETPIEFFTASPPMGLLLIKPAELLLFYTGADSMLTLPVDQIEPALQWALDLIASKHRKLDWVRLTNDLSIWERETTRLRWAEEFLKLSKEDGHVN